MENYRYPQFHGRADEVLASKMAACNSHEDFEGIIGDRDIAC
jgi:hypothetical protein